ncbi:Uncharacterised protein [Mycobacteroides abscessus subsp. massiliense]|nr:Uncharacterised protein [Mycobacteroides abscessus subsp. massiliense]
MLEGVDRVVYVGTVLLLGPHLHREWIHRGGPEPQYRGHMVRGTQLAALGDQRDP